METFRFRLSLRLSHPSLTLGEISMGVGLPARGGWNAGEARKTPKGQPLSGFNRETYWYTEISHPEEASLTAVLAEHLSALELRRDFLQEFRSTGGRAEYFVGWFTTERSGGETLPSEILRRLGELSLDLSLDVYAPESKPMQAQPES